MSSFAFPNVFYSDDALIRDTPQVLLAAGMDNGFSIKRKCSQNRAGFISERLALLHPIYSISFPCLPQRKREGSVISWYILPKGMALLPCTQIMEIQIQHACSCKSCPIIDNSLLVLLDSQFPHNSAVIKKNSYSENTTT